MATQFPEVEAAADYVFRAKAQVLDAGCACIEIFGVDGGGTLTKIKKHGKFLERKDGWQTIQMAFNSGAYVRARFVTRAPGKDMHFPIRVVWDDWQLSPAK